MFRLFVDLFAYDTRRLWCWAFGHRFTDRTDPIACLWCGRRG